ncbi:MAG: preprotein translocase subunit SecY, partial [Gemmatimonadetes bacterium]|nr:preprotein translocase subunit SecY [Gemmatimonadota bacterium]
MTTPRVPTLAIDKELRDKLLFTLLALVIYRIGAHIAAPGVNVTALADFIRNSAAAGFFGLYDALGGGLSRATIFALGIMPYISASIIFQLAGGIAPSIGKMIGNGMSLLITFSILERVWPSALQLVQFVRTGVISPIGAIVLLAVVVAVMGAVVAMTIAARRIPIQIPRKVMGRGRIREGQKTFIPIRLITAGVMPIIFAQTIIIVPGTLASFTQNPVLQDVASFFSPGELPYDLTFAVMILLFSYFYTSIIFNSVDLAENLKKQGGFIPGVKPGGSTADYIDAVLARITLPGGLFLAGVAIL